MFSSGTSRRSAIPIAMHPRHRLRRDSAAMRRPAGWLFRGVGSGHAGAAVHRVPGRDS
jgi:hypothetical protein